MDLKIWTRKLPPVLSRNLPVFLLVFVGILLMLIPSGSKSPQKQVTEERSAASGKISLQDNLCQILSQLQGAGQVQVLLTEQQGQRIQYQYDEDEQEGERHRKTILIQGAGREEAGLIRQVDPPTYQGAIVLCQGADRASIRLDIINAVSSVTGLGSDRITVLKME